MTHSKALLVTQRAPVLIAARTWCTRANADAEEDLVAAAAENFVWFLFRVTLSTRVYRIWHAAFATGFIASQAGALGNHGGDAAHRTTRHVADLTHPPIHRTRQNRRKSERGQRAKSHRRGSEALRDT